MLTDSEKEWLEQRDAIQFACGSYRVPWLKDGYSLDEDLREAAEFEARVAAQLLEYHVLIMQQGGICEECVAWNECGDAETQCKPLLMKYARITVEEEMEDVNRC